MAVRCLRPCDRLPSPWSVILPHLRMRRNEWVEAIVIIIVTQLKFKIDSVKGCKMLEDLATELSSPWSVILRQLRMRINELEASLSIIVTSLKFKINSVESR